MRPNSNVRPVEHALSDHLIQLLRNFDHVAYHSDHAADCLGIF